MGSQPVAAFSKPVPPPNDPTEERGLRGLPPFVDVVYGAVFGYGIFEIAQAVLHWKPRQTGNATPIFLLVSASVYLLFDYAQARMFTEKHPYRGLTRFTLDVAIAVAFTFQYVAASLAHPYYLLALTVILLLGAWWVAVCKSEYPHVLQRSGFIITCHIVAGIVLVAIWGMQFLPFLRFGTLWHRWIDEVVLSLYFVYCVVLTVITTGTRATEIERSLLPIVPLYAPWRKISVLFSRRFHL